MRAAIFKEAGQPVVIEERPDPKPGPDEVVVKVGRCGICGSDVHMTEKHAFSFAAGSALGHEFAGEVVEVGSAVKQLKPGDIISAMPMAGCGTCAACVAGHPVACPQWHMMMGGFAHYTVAKAALATKLPAALSLEDGALVEPVACSLHTVKMGGIEPGARVLVLGAGGVGLGAVFWARRLGAGKIAVVARSDWRKPMALGMGADAFVVSDDNLAANVNEALGGPPDIVFEAIGSPGIIAQAIDLVRPRGTVVVAGCCTQPDSFVPFLAMFKELRLQFVSAYTLQDFQITVDAMDRGALEARTMVTDTLPLDAMPAALESLRAGGRHCKILIDPWMT